MLVVIKVVIDAHQFYKTSFVIRWFRNNKHLLTGWSLFSYFCDLPWSLWTSNLKFIEFLWWSMYLIRHRLYHIHDINSDIHNHFYLWLSPLSIIKSYHLLSLTKLFPVNDCVSIQFFHYHIFFLFIYTVFNFYFYWFKLYHISNTLRGWGWSHL